jgi:hypothetical protein
MGIYLRNNEKEGKSGYGLLAAGCRRQGEKKSPSIQRESIGLRVQKESWKLEVKSWRS